MIAKFYVTRHCKDKELRVACVEKEKNEVKLQKVIFF